jgi:hypothetical protein
MASLSHLPRPGDFGTCRASRRAHTPRLCGRGSAAFSRGKLHFPEARVSAELVSRGGGAGQSPRPLRGAERSARRGADARGPSRPGFQPRDGSEAGRAEERCALDGGRQARRGGEAHSVSLDALLQLAKGTGLGVAGRAERISAPGQLPPGLGSCRPPSSSFPGKGAPGWGAGTASVRWKGCAPGTAIMKCNRKAPRSATGLGGLAHCSLERQHNAFLQQPNPRSLFSPSSPSSFFTFRLLNKA